MFPGESASALALAPRACGRTSLTSLGRGHAPAGHTRGRSTRHHLLLFGRKEASADGGLSGRNPPRLRCRQGATDADSDGRAGRGSLRAIVQPVSSLHEPRSPRKHVPAPPRFLRPDQSCARAVPRRFGGTIPPSSTPEAAACSQTSMPRRLPQILLSSRCASRKAGEARLRLPANAAGPAPSRRSQRTPSPILQAR